MTPTEIRTVEACIGYQFRNRALLKQAFTRSSYVNEKAGSPRPSDTQSNEVLEFLGDSILSATLAILLVEKYGSVGQNGLTTDLTEKDFSIIKSNMSDKSALANAIRRLGVGRYMRLSRGDENQNVLAQDSPNEDLFESIIAAVALDSDMDWSVIIEVVKRLDDVERLLRARTGGATKNAKTRVKEYCEKRHIPYLYEITGTEGPDHDKRFFCRLTVDGAVVTEGVGPGRAKAEMDAATKMVARLEGEGKPV